MRREIDGEDVLLATAGAAVDAPGRSEPVSPATRSLADRRTARSLIALGASDPTAAAAPRRRFD